MPTTGGGHPSTCENLSGLNRQEIQTQVSVVTSYAPACMLPIEAPIVKMAEAQQQCMYLLYGVHTSAQPYCLKPECQMSNRE